MTAGAVRSLVVLVFTVCVLAPVGHGILDAAQAPTKVAFVTVVGEKGPLKTLTAKDFIAFEDNSKRDVVGAELSGDPLSIFLIVDTSAPLVVSKRVTFALPWCANVTAYWDASVLATTTSAGSSPLVSRTVHRIPPFAFAWSFCTDSRFALLVIIGDA